MSDHPYIENLSLVLNGLPVRETVREIFQNPNNGTPDNISKAGCLALALKSNEVGAIYGGYWVWNSWRQYFPSVHLESGAWLNTVDFVKEDFRGSHLNFAGFVFGGCANFRGAQWGDGVSFQDAQWGDFANFDEARWGNNANFVGAKWGSMASFNGTQWGNNANFEGAQWGKHANFWFAQWGTNAYFRGAQWDDYAKFLFAHWDTYAHFEGAHWGDRVVFQGARWMGDVDFSARSWETLKDAYSDEARYQVARAWAEARGLNPSQFSNVDFSGASFLGEARFSNRHFMEATNFGLLHPDSRRLHLNRDAQGQLQRDQYGLSISKDDLEQHRHITFGKPPIFHGCELHQDTSFEGAVFPPPTGSEEAARAYRTLKLAFSKQQAIREEQRFFRLEMEEETLRETAHKRWLFQAYKKFSDYGFSITRPLQYGGLGVLGLTVVYGLLSWLGHCGLSVQSCHFAPQWLDFSLLQTLPLPGLDKLIEAASNAFWPEGAWWNLGLSALVIVHKTVSVAALFLIGLALRNLFKLK